MPAFISVGLLGRNSRASSACSKRSLGARDVAAERRLGLRDRDGDAPAQALEILDGAARGVALEVARLEHAACVRGERGHDPIA